MPYLLHAQDDHIGLRCGRGKLAAENLDAQAVVAELLVSVQAMNSRIVDAGQFLY